MFAQKGQSRFTTTTIATWSAFPRMLLALCPAFCLHGGCSQFLETVNRS